MNPDIKPHIKRPLYIDRARPFLAKNLIKIFTGQRRTGKSFMLFQIMDLVEAMHPGAHIIYIDKDIHAFDFIRNDKDLLDHVEKNRRPAEMNFLFIDEVQEIEQFEKALRSLLVKGNMDIWCTGSNSSMLSGDLATVLSGRYIEIRIHGLSFSEFLIFHKFEDNAENLSKYLKYGGLPNLMVFPLTDQVVFDYLKSINATVLLKDVVARYNIRHVNFLENLIRFLADSTGSLISTKRISDYLKSQQMAISPVIIANYLSYLASAYYITRVPRSDLQGKKIFETSEKYYFEDLGLRNVLIGYKPQDIHKLIENSVFQHMIRMGFNVCVGKTGDKEIDFICERQGEKIYIQCAYLLTDDQTIEREFGNLLLIKDNYPKFVVTMDDFKGNTNQGIIHSNLKEFLQMRF
jgi:predicted AAA+ superfamily ATPase